MPAEMPQGKPPGAPGGAAATYGGSSSSASGQVIGGHVYPPSLPPAPKAKAMVSPWTPSPPKWPYTPQPGPFELLGGMASGIYNMTVGAMPSLDSMGGGGTTHYGRGLDYEEQLQAYHEQQQQMKDRQQRLLGQQASNAGSMARQHLSDVSQQQQMFSPPRLNTKYRHQQSPESQ